MVEELIAITLNKLINEAVTTKLNHYEKSNLTFLLYAFIFYNGIKSIKNLQYNIFLKDKSIKFSKSDIANLEFDLSNFALVVSVP